MSDQELIAAVARLTECGCPSCQRILAALEAAQADVRRYLEMLFAKGAMMDAPCFVCGYNGPGYFQPDKHPCAARHHAAALAVRAGVR